jgi:hypothetical protein
MMDKVILIIVLGALIGTVVSQNTTANPTHATSAQSSQTSDHTSTSFRSTSFTSKTTLSPEQECARLSSNCDSCVENKKCFYCYSNNSCKLYPDRKILPSSDDCTLSEARWGVCWLNFEALIISVSVIGGVLIFTASCCIYCCCCRNRDRKREERENQKFNTQKMERKSRQDDRKAERKDRMDDIRKKYGLMKDDAA